MSVCAGCTRIAGSDYPMDTKFMTVSIVTVVTRKENAADPKTDGGKYYK